jgi:hypothetical protein
VTDPVRRSVGRWARRHWRHIGIGLVMVWMARSVQEAGHGWGDDFALYINQARGLSDGTLWDVVADNRFGLSNSAYSTFSPVAYPWVLPLLLFPIVTLFGIDYAMLKLVGTLAFAAAGIVTMVLTARRAGRITAGLVSAMVILNPWYLSSTDAVLSDLLFMALVLSVIAALDRAIDGGGLATGRLSGRAAWPVVTAVVLIALAMHTRREGLALVVVLAAAQFAAARRRTGDDPTDPATRRTPWRPWLLLTGLAGGLHLMLPAPLLSAMRVGDSDRSRMLDNLRWYREPFAELIGLKAQGDNPIEWAGSTLVGTMLLAAVITLAVIGAVDAVVSTVRRTDVIDLHVVAAVLAIAYVVLSPPYRYQRYIFVLVPLLLILAVRGSAALGRAGRSTVLPVLLTVLVVAPLVVEHSRQTVNAVRFHRAHDYVMWGPEAPEARELFDAVRRFTDERDVVVFAQARSMNLYTGRLSIQGNDRRMLLERGDWYAMARDSDYIQVPLDPAGATELGLEAVWSNSRFVLWRIPEREIPAVDPWPSGPALTEDGELH